MTQQITAQCPCFHSVKRYSNIHIAYGQLYQHLSPALCVEPSTLYSPAVMHHKPFRLCSVCLGGQGWIQTEVL